MDSDKILLVDDEPVTALAQASKLEELGGEVMILNSGKETLKYIKNNDHIDIILMDIELNEELDGIEVAEKIHQEKDIPILFLTAHEDPNFLKRVKNTDSYNYLLKSTSGKMISIAIYQALKLHEAQKKIRIQNRRLRKKEEIYRKIVKISREAMAIIKEKRILFSNNSFCRLIGCCNESIENQLIDQVDVLKDLNRIIGLDIPRDKQAEFTFKFEMADKSGDNRHIKARLIQIELQNQPASVLTLYDYTREKKLIAKVEKAEKLADDLGNFIPICASCKSIKEESEGQKIWIEPEKYITGRLPDVQFTHGICPECAEKLYPEFTKNRKKQKTEK